MPRVATLAGNIAIYMYRKDHNPPHVHVVLADVEAALAFDGSVLIGKLPAKALKAAKAWIVANKAELEVLWEEMK